MSIEVWNVERWKTLFEVVGPVVALLFTGLALHTDARVRRAETQIEITKHHREIWMYFDEHPELERLFDSGRDIQSNPLSGRERRFVNFVLNHLRATFYSRLASIYVQPERLKEDVRDFLSHPATRDAWSHLKRFHDARFVAFVDSCLSA